MSKEGITVSQSRQEMSLVSEFLRTGRITPARWSPEEAAGTGWTLARLSATGRRDEAVDYAKKALTWPE